jgi:Flp pilus assembly protein TadG
VRSRWACEQRNMAVKHEEQAVAGQRIARCSGAGRCRGQSLVELALVLPLLTLILVGAVDLGRVFISYAQLTNAVKEGALFGADYPSQIQSSSNPPDPNYITSRVRAEANLGSGLANTDITVQCYRKPAMTTSFSCDDGTVSSGDLIEVTASYAFKPITTQMIGFLPSTYKIRKAARMIIW